MTTREKVKTTIKMVFLALTLPLYLLYRLISIPCNPDSTFQTCSQLLSLIPGKAGIYLRAAFYRLACPETSDDISIGFLTVFSHRDTTIGKGVYIGPQGNIGKCRIKANTLLGSGVHILSGKGQHNFNRQDAPIKEQGGSFEKITVGEDCWIGNGAIVMAGVPDHCIIAAGSVYTQELEQPWSIAGGNPARLLKTRNEGESKG
ncbi:MAG: acyltransferase [Alteromonadaceae bacterium]|nr:acyltransferase [Alteromonadaceae bacterium]